MLYGIPQYQFNRLQRVLNAAARVVFVVPRFEHISPVLKELHWLPVRYHVEFKIALLVFNLLHGEAPAYLENLLRLKDVGIYRLRSSRQKLLLEQLVKHLETVLLLKLVLLCGIACLLI